MAPVNGAAQKPRLLRQLPRAPHGAGRWRGSESPADTGSYRAPRTPDSRRWSMAQRREPRRHRQLQCAPHVASQWRSSECFTISDSCRAPRTAQVDGTAASAPKTQAAEARPARRRSMAQWRESQLPEKNRTRKHALATHANFVMRHTACQHY